MLPVAEIYPVRPGIDKKVNFLFPSNPVTVLAIANFHPEHMAIKVKFVQQVLKYFILKYNSNLSLPH